MVSDTLNTNSYHVVFKIVLYIPSVITLQWNVYNPAEVVCVIDGEIEHGSMSIAMATRGETSVLR